MQKFRFTDSFSLLVSSQFSAAPPPPPSNQCLEQEGEGLRPHCADPLVRWVQALTCALCVPPRRARQLAQGALCNPSQGIARACRSALAVLGSAHYAMLWLATTIHTGHVRPFLRPCTLRTCVPLGLSCGSRMSPCVYRPDITLVGSRPTMGARCETLGF